MFGYATFVLLAIVVVFGGILISSIYDGRLPIRKVFISLLASLIGALIGARILYLATDPGFSLTGLIDPDFRNFALIGGIAGGGVVGLLTSVLLKIPLPKFGNISFIWIGLGIGIIRIGCFIEGCCFGKPTNLPWGVHPHLFSVAHWEQLSDGTATLLSTQPIHPTQIYELLAALIASWIGYVLYKKKPNTYIPMLNWIGWFTLFRLILFYLRAPSVTYSGPLWLYPVLYLVIIGVVLDIYVHTYQSMSSK